jgi:hypothetical protein
MDMPISKPLKTAYVLSVIAVVMPSIFLLIISGEIKRQLSFGAFSTIVSLGATFLLLALCIYRLVIVFRQENALASYQVSGPALLLRRVGAAFIYIGAGVLFLNFAAFPLIKAFVMHNKTDGVEFFVGGLYLSYLQSFGDTGLIMFELSRLIGFENHVRNQKFS